MCKLFSSFVTIAAICMGVPNGARAALQTTVENTSATSAHRPNVIVILSDDQGYGDFSCHGNPILKTPALDKLNGESIRFSNFHVAPLCTPTRGQLMSGMEAMRNKASTVLTARGLMRRDILTMPEVFADNGYRTGIFGKWHLGDAYPDRPMDRGFEKCVWTKGWGLLSEMEFDNDYYQTRYLDSLDTCYAEKYCTDLWFDEAMAWMGEMAKEQQPFFTYLALNAPHGPFHSPEKNRKHYLGKVADDKVASIYGMVENIDENMAKLDAWLEQQRLKENTLIIFMNDNGAPKGLEMYNADMRGWKGDVYDGGHRAACFIRWPNGSFGRPTTVGYPTAIHDLLPTFIDLFDFSVPSGYPPFDGISLVSVLERPMADHGSRMFVVQYGNYPKTQQYDGCVVWDAWRLVGKDELYNLDEDPGQERNIAKEYPDVVEQMKTYYDAWWTGVAPGIDEFVPLIVGSEEEDSVILSCGFWEGGDVNTQWAVANGAGGETGGQWHIDVVKQGTYLLELSRWPFHLERQLTQNGPSESIAGTALRTGKSLPITYGCVQVDNSERITSSAAAGAVTVNTKVTLTKGSHLLKAFFKDRNKNNVCGAYYVRVSRLK